MKKTLSTIGFACLFLFFASFMAQKNDTTGNKPYGELGTGPSNTTKVTTTTGSGGVLDPAYRDRLYLNENTPKRRPIPYTYLRQADVSFEKRVWRVIDMREKVNQPLMFPAEPMQNRKALLDVVKEALKNGQIKAFDDDEFVKELPYEEIMKKFTYQTTMKEVDSLGNEQTTIIDNKLENSGVTQLRLKEDWFFDKQRSVLDVRVLSVGFYYLKPGKEEAGPIPLFYLYFPQCRDLFSKNEMYNPKNDAERRTYEDFFWKRQFNSYIERESNIYERNIASYARGLDQLLESDRIKGDMYRWEHDLWHF